MYTQTRVTKNILLEDTRKTLQIGISRIQFELNCKFVFWNKLVQISQRERELSVWLFRCKAKTDLARELPRTGKVNTLFPVIWWVLKRDARSQLSKYSAFSAMRRRYRIDKKSKGFTESRDHAPGGLPHPRQWSKKTKDGKDIGLITTVTASDGLFHSQFKQGHKHYSDEIGLFEVENRQWEVLPCIGGWLGDMAALSRIQFRLLKHLGASDE